MKCITLKAGSQMDYTTVSNIFIDNYMPQANGEFVKIYLYLLRCMSDPDMDLSISMIADKFDQTEKDVHRALRYFAGKGLLSIEYGPDDELSAITFLPVNSELTVVSDTTDNEADRLLMKSVQKPAASVPDTDIPLIQDSSAIPDKPAYTTAMLTEFSENEEIAQLLYITQKYIGRTLSNAEAGSIIYMYDSLNFSTELIEYVIEYCVSNNHKSMRYMEKVALDWASAGIDTVDAAREYSGNYTQNVYSVMKAFGLSSRAPGEIEKKYITKWFNEYGFDADIVVEACNRTLQTIHKPNFEYADTILKKWKQNNVVHLRDIAVLDQLHASKKQSGKSAGAVCGSANKFNNYPQRTYDFNQLEKILQTK